MPSQGAFLVATRATVDFTSVFFRAPTFLASAGVFQSVRWCVAALWRRFYVGEWQRTGGDSRPFRERRCPAGSAVGVDPTFRPKQKKMETDVWGLAKTELFIELSN